MRDTELYQQVLGLEAPWAVSRVELSAEGGRIDVWAEHARRTQLTCPECSQELSVYDHGDEREWRHLDTCGFLTFLHAWPPRVECPTHGVRQVVLPWAEPMSRFTILFERLAVDVLGAANVTRASQLLHTSWDETWGLMARAVSRGQAAKAATVPAHLGVDEKSAGRGHDYITVVSDLARGTVEYIADERKKSSLDSYFDQYSPEQLARIKAVGMDMWEPFALSVRDHLEGADDKIVYDKFHVMKYLGTAVDTVRKQENRVLVAAGDKSLTSTKYLWLHSAENLPERHIERFGELRGSDLKTGRAWAIKESFRWFYDYQLRGWGEKHWKNWYFWATHSKLQPVIDAAKTLKRHEAGLLSFFAHRITSAGAEGLNSKIQAIRVSARGFRNRENFKTAIYFHCGGLELYPQTH
jgi:transposase